MKNFTQVNRASSGAKKNFTQLESNLSGMAWNLHVIKRRFSSADKLSGSRIESSLTLAQQPGNHPVITPKSPLNHPLLARVWRYVALMVMVFGLGVGEMWGDSETTTTTTTTWTFSDSYRANAHKPDNGLYFSSAGGSNSMYIKLQGDNTAHINIPSGVSGTLAVTYIPNSGDYVALDMYVNSTLTDSHITHEGSGTEVSHTFNVTNSTGAVAAIYLKSTRSSSSSGENLTSSGKQLNVRQVVWTPGSSTKRIYMKCGSTWCDNVSGSAPKFFAHSWDGSTTANSAAMQHPSTCETDVYYADIPSSHTSVIFTRQKAASTELVWSGDNFVNQSQDITISTNNLFTCTGWSDGKGTFSGGTYSAPSYTISYSANGGTGTTASNTSIACGGSATLTTNGFTYAGYSFNCWHADVATTVGGAAKAAGADIAGGSSLSNITSDITMTAQWTREMPTSVTVTGGWAYFPGQTITFTAEPTGGTGDFSYQWQKKTGNSYTDIKGATSATYTKTNCTIEDCGSYRCKVGKAGGYVYSDAGGDAHNVRIHTLNGNYTGEGFESHNITYSSGTSGTVTLSLNANSVYEFKIYDNYTDGRKEYGYAAGNYIISPVNYDCGTGNSNIRLFTGPAGDYTFTVNLAHVGGNSPYVNVAVAYPSVSHPAAGYAYFEKPNDWTNVYLYWYTDNSYRMTDWNGAPEVVTTTEICGTTYYYAPVGTEFDYLKLKGNSTNEWTAISTSGCSGKYMDETTYASPAWTAFPTYTISFDGNSNTGGSMSDIGSITANKSQTITSNAFTKTGHTFAGWKANVDVKINGSTVSAGTVISNGATIQNICSDIELTAQWNVNSYDLTWNLGGGTTTSTGTGISSGVSANTTSSVNYGTSLTAPTVTKTNYDFAGWSPSVASTMPASNTTYTATWTAQTHDVAFTLTNAAYKSGTDEGDDVATYGTDYGVVFAADDGYSFPSDITVQIGGVTKTKDTHYTWNSSTGALTVTGSYITGDIAITVTATSSCSTPADPDGLAAGSISSSGVTFTITDDESPASYEIYYSTDDDAPEASTVASATTTSKSKDVTGLTANTTYYAWVRAVCDGSHKSDWVALTGSTFKTLAEGTKYFLFEPTSAPNPSHTGTLSGQFRCSTSSPSSASQTFDTYTMSHHCKFSTVTSLGSSSQYHGKDHIAYDIKTNSTTFTLYFYNNSSYDRDIYYALIEEGITSAPTPVKVSTATTKKIGTATFTVTASKNTRIVFFTEDQSNMRCYQIVAGENGTALPKPGESSYKIGFKGIYSRFTDYTEGTGKQGTLDDSVKVVCYSNYGMGSDAALKIRTKGTDYISFRTGASACQVKVCVSSSKTYYLGTSASATTNSQTDTHTFDLSANTRYYINPGGNDVTVDSIVFLPAAASTYELTWNTNGGSDLSCTGTCTEGDLASGTTIVAPTDPTLSNYTFDGWKTANDGTGSAAAATMPAEDVTYYAAWKQTVTLTTGAQGDGGNQTPYVYLNGTGVSSFTAHTASGYSLQGYYTAGSGGVKVLNADGTFASANVDGYITSSKWSRTGAAPTLYAQWVASEDCSTSDFVIQKGSSEQYQGCMESSSYNGTATSFTAGSPTTVGKAKMTISNYKDGVIKRPGSGKTFTIVIEPVSGYYLKSICWAGKVENDETVSYYWDNNSGSATTITPQTTSGTGVTYNAPNSTTTKFTASYVDDGDGSGGIWWRNVQVEVCAAGGTTYSVTYNGNDETSGSVPTGATNYSYGATVTVLDNTGSFAKTNYTFAGWTTNNDGTGSNYVADNTFSITANTTLYAKWTQSVKLDKNGGSTDGSATAVWNATGLTGITHAKPAAGYKLLGYYSASSDGTKVLNSDGSFAATNVTDYITSGKWSRTSATTLYAQYESAGALIWNLSVNTDATSLTTSSKTSAFTEISTSNMSNATVNGVSYEKSKKSSLTGMISTPSSYNAGDYVYVKFVVASGYKFTPSSVKVIAQPITTAKSVKLVLEDKNDHSIYFTTASTISGGTTQTVEMTNSSVYFVDTVTLKIYCYGAEDKYRLGTPIIIEGEVEEACATMPSFTRLSFGETSYKVDDTPDNLEVVGGTNITTYAWKQNTTNDRSGGGDAAGDNDGSSYTPSTSSAGTMYYWCEMTNSTCGITIKTSAVGITVNEVKTNPTITWDTKAKYDNTDTTAYYGGKNYTLKATLNSGWNGTLTADMFTAPTGIRLYDFTIDNSSNPKTIKATFDVQTTFDIDENDSIDFTLSLPATTTYNALSSEKKVAYNECSGSGEGATYNLKVRKTTTKDGNYYYWANTDGWISMNPNSSFSSKEASSTYQGYDSVYNTNGQQVFVRTYHANINKVRIYADFRANNMTVSNVYKHTTYFSAESKYEISADDYTAVYNGDEENANLGDAANGYVDIILNKAMSENDILLVKFNTSRVRPYGAKLTESSAGSLTTSLVWSGGISDGGSVTGKTQSSANFTYTASTTGTNSNTLGAISYSSSNTSCATVNATTGEVTITATGTSDLSTTITATLAASGCYKGKTITYTISVPGVSCSVTTGTLASDVTTKCSTANATLTLTGFESGATVQWYKGESTISNDATYAITTKGTTSTMVTKEAGTYSVMVTKDKCSDRSNSITISNISATASVTKIVDEWYVKNGRLTPDIELWSLSEGATLKSVAWSPTNETGLSCVARGGIIYLEGKEPSSNDSGADIEYTLTATITDECNTDHIETTKTIKITHQKNTDKHVLAFVVNGTDKGGFTEGITAAQTTDVSLYKTIAANFDVQATNCYASDDEKKVKQYYSQFDILCITDYPNSNTKGVNKKKYVDVLGTLIDIRPILTMEAFVSDKDNWKAKGISGNPKDPTTRQYTMDLQCKDHEIFAGTNLVKIGEGDETMYRVTMVEKDSDQYKTLDATYGAGSHGKDDGYAYHKYPALQGFTFSTEMLSDGLLPLGLIDDGSGNELQVGIERQAEMSARLMVLGVNSYAMERLTPDGQKVIINALNYLMKKNEEEIADCSIAFIGGDETNPKDWNTAANWKGGVKPDKTTREIRILAEVVIKNGDSIHAMAPIKIASRGTYNEGADIAAGKITINAGGALIVDGRIQAVTAPNYSKARGTSVEDIVLNTSSSAQAALIFNNDAGDTKATVKFYSLGRNDGVFQYQYIASPMEVVPVSESYHGSGVYTYVYTEAAGWERRGYYTDLYAFEGVAITTRSTIATEYTVQGTLANTKEREISITKDHGGDNMIGNSWVAPIQISELEKAPNTATLESKTVYVYCSGRDAVKGTGASGPTETAGQWLAIPFYAAGFADWSGLKVVPAMNAFEFMATAAGTITLNYDTLVRGNHQNLTAKARAPKRKTEHEGIDLVRIRVADTKTHNDIHLFEGDVFSEAFDDGWEAKYIDGEGVSAQLYAMNGEDKMAVLATSTLEGTVLGFVPGREREYTFSFHGADNGYYLNDLKLKTSTPISETEHYTFTYEEGDTHRFYISKTAIDAPQTPTDVTNPEVETPKAQKFIYKDKMYIMINGRVYSAEGQLVK